MDGLFDVFDGENSSSNKRQKKLESVAAAVSDSIEVRAEKLLAELSDTANKRKSEHVEVDDSTPAKSVKLHSLEEDLGSLESMPRISIHTIDTMEACMHKVAVPHDSEYVPLKPRTGPAAKEYPFVLDPFQTQALLCLDNYQSVMVSAHTSAGKTVVAEYAIGLSLKDKQRVIYTTPIKALSNQKYREMYEDFGDVGLMTGDVTINPTASCIVMTTEILRSMLYRGSEMMREVGWVVFDEIHYMRDKERGVVWEETIILLPDAVKYVFLSATIPNALQFAEWICYLHRQPCHVVYTEFRPVPLQHYVYPAGGDGLHLVVNEKGEFRDENFANAMVSLSGLKEGEKKGGKKWGKNQGQSSAANESNVLRILKLTDERQLTPVIVFSFSRKECEAYGLNCSSQMDLNTSDQKALVKEVYENAMFVLSEEDHELPQVKQMLPLLMKGIGIHHSGLLPILKETVEILFGEGLIKILFATETFAMGLNMPARTVIFTTVRKFDGQSRRNLTSGEYIQMSGRAGRRGKDDRGIVVMMVDEMIAAESIKGIIKGDADPLNSQFRLTYNMVLNLLRVEGINPEFMLERSFYQFQNYAALPGLYEKVRQCEERMNAISVPQEIQVSGYHKIKNQISTLDSELQKIITAPNHIIPFLQPGRMVHVKHNDMDFGWGIVVNFYKKMPSDKAAIQDPTFVVDVLMHIVKDDTTVSTGGSLDAKPVPEGQTGIMEVIPIQLNAIFRISSVRVHYPEDLRTLDNRMLVLKTIRSVQKKFSEGPPLLDPVQDMDIAKSEVQEIVDKLQLWHQRLYDHPLRNSSTLEELTQIYQKKIQAEKELRAATDELRKARSLLQLDELKCRKRVLRRLNYADAQDVINMKGRVACEISAGDELLLTEMLFNGVFNDLSTQQATALLSCFVFEENAEMPQLVEDLQGVLRQMQEMARRIAKVSTEAKMPLDEEEYANKFKPNLMQVVHAWASGSTFAQICEMTEIFEGSIIRCMRRLEELMREMKSAATSMGNADLEKKFADGIVRIKRDIVFAASLYL